MTNQCKFCNSKNTQLLHTSYPSTKLIVEIKGKYEDTTRQLTYCFDCGKLSVEGENVYA